MKGWTTDYYDRHWSSFKGLRWHTADTTYRHEQQVDGLRVCVSWVSVVLHRAPACSSQQSLSQDWYTLNANQRRYAICTIVACKPFIQSSTSGRSFAIQRQTRLTLQSSTFLISCACAWMQNDIKYRLQCLDCPEGCVSVNPPCNRIAGFLRDLFTHATVRGNFPPTESGLYRVD